MTMQYQPDLFDDEWDKMAHTPDEYRAEIRQLRERCAAYAAEIERLRGQRAGCAYPNCLDGGGRCHAMFKGECSGPKQGRTTI
jgi:hypothetical protein